MKDVYKLLQERCAFGFNMLFSVSGSLESVCIVPESMLKLGLPDDFTGLYRKCNGGHQNFTGHGWPAWQGPIVLRLFELAEMQGRTIRAREHAEKALDAHCAKEGVGKLRGLLKREQLKRAFQKTLIIGEIAPPSASGKEALTTCIVFAGNGFITATMDDFTTLGIYGLEDWLGKLRVRENVVYDESLYGILNKLLDIILKDKSTILKLSAEQMAQRRLAREERSPAEERIKNTSGLIASGKIGDNLTWMLDEEGVMTIRGKGPMTSDFHFPEGISVSKMCRLVRKVVIEPGVTAIEEGAFDFCTELHLDEMAGEYEYITNLSIIILPDTLIEIGDMAFCGLSSLQSIEIPNGVNHIGDLAFAYCRKLDRIRIPRSVTFIGDGAFEQCRSFTHIVIPESVSHIGEGIFEECYFLEDIYVDSTNPSYADVDGILYNKDKTRMICRPYRWHCQINASV